MNDSNLIPNTERSPEELREMGRRGGIASGKSRRKKRELQKLAQMLLDDTVIFFRLPDGQFQSLYPLHGFSMP